MKENMTNLFDDIHTSGRRYPLPRVNTTVDEEHFPSGARPG